MIKTKFLLSNTVDFKGFPQLNKFDTVLAAKYCMFWTVHFWKRNALFFLHLFWILQTILLNAWNHEFMSTFLAYVMDVFIDSANCSMTSYRLIGIIYYGWIVFMTFNRKVCNISNCDLSLSCNCHRTNLQSFQNWRLQSKYSKKKVIL